MNRKNRIRTLIAGCIVVVLAIILGAVIFPKKEVYEVAVQVRDQTNPDPEEDLRTSLKRGDAAVVFPEGHKWSDTERMSYLILKMEMSKKESKELVQSETELIEGPPGEKAEENIVRLRTHTINLEHIGFNQDNVKDGQPFEDEIFEWNVVTKK